MTDDKALTQVLTVETPERTLDAVTLEIKTLQRQSMKNAVQNQMESLS